jgi:hypothetical protein
MMARIGFDHLKQEFMKEGKSAERAAGLAAYIGRKKYGKAKFQKMAAAGRKKKG